MARRQQASGFITILVVVVLVTIAVGFVGAYAWHKTKQVQPVNTTTKTATAETKTDKKIPAGWILFKNDDLGLSFAYPSSWAIRDLQSIATASGELGWRVTIEPQKPIDGDPLTTISTYPGSATIKDVDANANDIKIQEVTNAEDRKFTLVGSRDDPAKSMKPQRMYASTCWPRNCTPKLLNGKFFGLAVGAANNSCEPKTYCLTDINTGNTNYGVFVDILQTIRSL